MLQNPPNFGFLKHQLNYRVSQKKCSFRGRENLCQSHHFICYLDFTRICKRRGILFQISLLLFLWTSNKWYLELNNIEFNMLKFSRNISSFCLKIKKSEIPLKSQLKTDRWFELSWGSSNLSKLNQNSMGGKMISFNTLWLNRIYLWFVDFQQK